MIKYALACDQGHARPRNRWPGPSSCGVWPPCSNQASASAGARPATMMLTAIAATTWLPRWVTQANAMTRASATAAATPAPRPSHAEPVVAATAAEANAAASILPSRPRSITPERSEKSPARAASTRGVATLIVAAKRRMISR